MTITIKSTREALKYDDALRTCQGWRDADHARVAAAAADLGLGTKWSVLVVALRALQASRHDTGRKNRLGLAVHESAPQDRRGFAEAETAFDAAVSALWADWLAGTGGKLARDAQGNAN